MSPSTMEHTAMPKANELPRFSRPYDWEGIDHAVRTVGGVIAEGLLDPAELAPLNGEIDDYLRIHGAKGAAPTTGSRDYDKFLGHKTLRLHGLIEKMPTSADLIGRPELVEWAERLMAPVADTVQLNAGELIEIQPGEPAQFLHRDSDSWPQIPLGPDPVIVNALVALDPCTPENGATHIASGSWQWERDRKAQPHEFVRAVMHAGDAVLFRGDLLHGGGENASDARRRILSISYCAGWLRPVENSFLNLSRETVSGLDPKLQAVLGYATHDASKQRGGMLGLYENGDPRRAL
jgi:ectoine hydroxylase-related dioxygenase (phytanoyl-CoA dioxygenase family)